MIKNSFRFVETAIALVLLPISVFAADTVFLSENIVTSNTDMPIARSMAVEGDLIVCLRADDSCGELARDGTRIVDAGTNTIMAGIMDTHLHT